MTTIEQTKYVVVDDTNFEAEVTRSEVPVLVDFWAPWCGPCRMIAPAIEQLAAEYEGRVKVAKLNVDEAPKTASQFDVRSIPTILFFKGGKVEDLVVGATAKRVLSGKLDQLLSKA